MLKRWFSLEVDEDFNTLIEICNGAYPKDAEQLGGLENMHQE